MPLLELFEMTVNKALGNKLEERILRWREERGRWLNRYFPSLISMISHVIN